jgi:hypothetical protein
MAWAPVFPCDIWLGLEIGRRLPNAMAGGIVGVMSALYQHMQAVARLAMGPLEEKMSYLTE